MRHLLITLAVLVAASMTSPGAAGPGESALAFLELLRKDESLPEDLIKKTSISPHCGESKRLLISQRLVRTGRDLRQNSYAFQILAEKQEGAFAAVLVAAVSEHNPLAVEVLALGLGEVDGTWKPAPLLGSFENCDTGFSDETEARLDQLELWMGRERVQRLRALQVSVEEDFRARMAKAVPSLMLEKANPKQIVKTFIEACLDGNLAAAMVLLGRFDEDPTEEDREVQRIVSRGLQGLDRRNHWRLLTSPGVVRVVVQEDDEAELDAGAVVLLFDPEDAAGTNSIRFTLQQSGKRWQLLLPTSLRLADAERLRFQRAIWRERDSDDKELRKRFAEFFEEDNKPRRDEDLEKTGQEIERVLRDGSLEEFFCFLHRSEDLTEGERRVAYAELGQFWTTFHEGEKAAADGELVKVLRTGDAGLLIFHVVSTAQLDRLKLKPLLLLKDENGWGIAPGVTTAGNYEALNEERREEQVAVIGEFIDTRADLTKVAADGFLERFSTVIPANGAKVDAEEALGLVRRFRNLLRTGKLLEAFACCALLDRSEGAWEALKSLSYEYRGAKLATEPDRELGVSDKEQWAAVTLRVDSGPSSVPDYPMYLVVATAGGPRIVVDVGLRLATNKGREVLNRNVWKRIEEQLEEKETGLVRGLFEEHVKRSRIDLTEWEKSNKSSP